MRKLVAGNLFVALVALAATVFVAFFIQSVLWGPQIGMFFTLRYPRLVAVFQVATCIVSSLAPLALLLRMAEPLFPMRVQAVLPSATVIAAIVALVGTPIVFVGLILASQPVPLMP